MKIYVEFFKVFYRALGLPLFLAINVAKCLHLDTLNKKLQWLTATISTMVNCGIVPAPYMLILLLQMRC